MKNTMPLIVNLQYGEYLNYGIRFHVSFVYSTEEQKQEIYTFFENIIPTYGANSGRNDFIRPYLIDDNGQQTTVGNTVGGTNIPEDLLIFFLKRFIEVDKANVQVGNVMITGKIEDELLNAIVQSLGPKLNKGFSK